MLALVCCSQASTEAKKKSSAAPGDPPAAADLPPGSSTSAGDDGGRSTDATEGPTTNGFPAKWIDGMDCAKDPEIQTWSYSNDTFILRQSLCTNFEGPFMYLLVGSKKALLVDTGTGGVDLRGAVTTLIGNKSVDLVVAHSHSHGDHVGGDGAFEGQPSTTVVGLQPSQVQAFFGISGDAAASFDLGGRTIDVIAIPGHQAAHIAIYDHETQLLLTGDTLYPGRLYIDDWNAYRTSIPRLVAFVDAGRPVSYVLGGHIELPAVGADYAYGAMKHPNEHVLQLGDADLRELRAAVDAMGATPHRDVHKSFIISP
jgi:glyoxylase-like metal-dependent hydrolase (beta-lactamase superfamily II)